MGRWRRGVAAQQSLPLASRCLLAPVLRRAARSEGTVIV